MHQLRLVESLEASNALSGCDKEIKLKNISNILKNPPINAEAINNIKIKIPEIQVFEI